LLSAFFFVIWIWPNAASTFSIIVVIACIGIIVFPLIRGNYRLYKKGEYSKSVYLRKTIMDTVGILIIGLFVLLIASALAKDIGQKVGKAVETYTPGLGIPAGIFSGLITAVLVGLCVGYIVRMIWIPITKIIMGSKQTDQ
jgi:hypothetical protein